MEAALPVKWNGLTSEQTARTLLHERFQHFFKPQLSPSDNTTAAC